MINSIPIESCSTHGVSHSATSTFKLQKVVLIHLWKLLYLMVVAQGASFVVCLIRMHTHLKLIDPTLQLLITITTIDNYYRSSLIVSLQKCYSKRFTTNSYFPFKTQKFSPVGVSIYSIHTYMYMCD